MEVSFFYSFLKLGTLINFMNNKVSQSVLVTGASGFIGLHLVRRLIAAGCRVICLVRTTSRIDVLSSMGVELVNGDITDSASIRRVLEISQAEIVFHLAGLTKTLRKEDFQRINKDGVESVAAACADCTAQPVLVVVSSLAAAGPCDISKPRIESDTSTPVSAYGRSKLDGEKSAAGYAGMVPISIVRPPIVFGAGDSGTMAMFQSIARWGIHVVPCRRDARFSLIHVADLVQGLLLVAEKGERLDQNGLPGQGVYFMAADEYPTYGELGQAIAAALGSKRAAVVHLPGLLVKLIGLLGDALGRIRRRPGWLNSDKMAEAMAGSWTCSSVKARSHLGWSPAANLAERLGETAKSIISQNGSRLIASVPRCNETAGGCSPAVIERPGTMDAASISRLEAMAYRFGRSYDSYLVMEMDREYFWASGYRAVLGFVLKGSNAVVIGGLIGPEAAREVLLTEFMDQCRRCGWRACFGLVPENDLPLFDRYGFQSTKIGEEAIINLRQCTWQGKAYEWVRRQSSYCQRHGLVCREIGSEAITASQRSPRIAELEDISRDFLDRSPHGHKMRYFVSRFDPDRLFRRRVFAAIAEGGKGRVEGFVVCTPYRNGAAWAIEMYRSRQDAVRGTVPFMIREAIQIFTNEKAEDVSLCLMPAARCDQRRRGDSWLIHKYIRITHHYLNFIFDTPGIYHFKTRFRPKCDNRYCCVWPKASLGPLHAILSTWGTLKFSPRLAIGRGIRRLRIRRQRSTLVKS
jgi:nucleoside-diphosphate-sugar epimerase